MLTNDLVGSGVDPAAHAADGGGGVAGPFAVTDELEARLVTGARAVDRDPATIAEDVQWRDMVECRYESGTPRDARTSTAGLSCVEQ
jgi:hypothetical protein